MTSLPPWVPDAFQYIGRSTTNGPLLDCTAMRDFITLVAIAGHGTRAGSRWPPCPPCSGYVPRPAPRRCRPCPPHWSRRLHRLGVGCGVLDGEPLVIAQVGVAFREAVVAHRCWTYLPSTSRASRGQRRASIPHMVVAEVHLPLHRNLGARGGDLGGDRLRGAAARAIGIDIPEHLAQRIDRHGEGFGAPPLYSSVMVTVAALLGRIEIGDARSSPGNVPRCSPRQRASHWPTVVPRSHRRHPRRCQHCRH